MDKKRISVLELLLAALLFSTQFYSFLDMPQPFSPCFFVFASNVVGLSVVLITRLRKPGAIRKSTWKKGLHLAAELLVFYEAFTWYGFPFPDVILLSSTAGLFFVFIVPMLLLAKKKAGFFSVAATVVAAIALFLIFSVNPIQLFLYMNGSFMLIGDFFLAAYIVSLSILGTDEEPAGLVFTQLVFSVILSFAAWLISLGFGLESISFTINAHFWAGVVYTGIFIRAVFALIHASCQKKISPVETGLLLSTQVVMALLLAPFLSSVFGNNNEGISGFQVTGCLLLLLTALLVNESAMKRLGYGDMSQKVHVDENGKTVYHSSVSRKMVFITLLFSLIPLGIGAVISLGAIDYIQDSVLETSLESGYEISDVSSSAIISELEKTMTKEAVYKSVLGEEKLSAFSSAIKYTASYAEELYRSADSRQSVEVKPADAKNGGVWTMQRILADSRISYEELQEEIGLLGNMIGVFHPVVQLMEDINAIYIGTESGALVSYDLKSGSAANRENAYFDFREREWYRRAKEAEDVIFTDSYQDAYSEKLIITCAYRVAGPDGSIAGCVGVDILVEGLYHNMVDVGVEEPATAVLLSGNGEILASKDIDIAEDPGISSQDSGRREALGQVKEQILQKRMGILSVGENQGAWHVAFSTIGSTGWKICIICPSTTALEPATKIRDSIQNFAFDIALSILDTSNRVMKISLLMVAVLILAVLLFIGRFSRKISDPLKKLEQDVDEISQGHFDRRTQVSTDDEIGNLAKSFNSMADSIQKYIVDLKEATAKEQRLAMELSLAAKIQADMLPRNFPAFPDRKEIDIYATMTPAKEVGGDFYDFFLADENHLAILMADVSGKSVPAALFMMTSKTLIKNRTLMDKRLSPADILRDVNNQICENNEEQLFITIWLAILDLRTGRGLAANAGHEHPALKKAAQGRFSLVKYRHSPALAAMEDMCFREHEFRLDPGDIIFVYTDGVTEAANKENELFGEERLIMALNKKKNVPLQELLQTVREEIGFFVGDAEQFDDITMLGFTWKGPAD